MNISMRKRPLVALLVAGFIVTAAPVAAHAYYGPVDAGPQAASNAGSSDVVLRRDGTKSTTLVADVSPAPTLRRDGTQAAAFVADVGPKATASGDGFDWGDAAIGAAAGLLIAALAGSAAARGRLARGPAGTRAAQGI